MAKFLTSLTAKIWSPARSKIFDFDAIKKVHKIQNLTSLSFLHTSNCSKMSSSEIDENKERTFIMVKPDGVQRGLVGDIIKRFETRGFKLIAIKLMTADESLLKKHYHDLEGQPFFNGLIKYMASGPVVPMVWEGRNIVKIGRMMLGATDPAASYPGTIRGDFSILVSRNIIHGSDAVGTAKYEIKLWFTPQEQINWDKVLDNKWIYE